MKPISIIVAVAENNVIGKDNQLIWHLPEDMKYFKQTTAGHTVVMGRKTWDSLRIKPLPNRRNIVVTSQNRMIEGAEVVNSIEAAVALCEGEAECFVIGGETIYRQFLPYTNKLYLTKVHSDFEGDTFFEMLNPAEWELTKSDDRKADERNKYDFSFLVYTRKQ